jgi:hypothetical protein
VLEIVFNPFFRKKQGKTKDFSRAIPSEVEDFVFMAENSAQSQ